MKYSFFEIASRVGFSLPKLSYNKILDGKKVSENIVQQCREIYSNSKKQKPHLTVILAGANPASQVYVKNKIKIFERAGFLSILKTFSENVTQEEIVNYIHECNENKNVHGILVQLPLPKQLNQTVILKEICFQKDVDGFSSENIGLLALNDPKGVIPCTPFGIMILLAAYGIDVAGKHCVIVGRSAIVGKPMGLLLLNANATVTFVHSQTVDMQTHTQMADILIVAAGQKHLIHKNHIKKDAIVVDVGIHRENDNRLTGDVHADVMENVSAITPVPGGVGPMTIASLLINTVLCQMSLERS